MVKIRVTFAMPAAMLLLAGAADAQPTIVSFDCVGATFTHALGIDANGLIAGICQVGGLQRGFRRNTGGIILVFSPPNAHFTSVAGISNDTIVGAYNSSTSSGNDHGFIRLSNGTFSFFNPIGSQKTIPRAIANMWIAGAYLPAPGLSNGFVVSPSATVSTFDPSGLHKTDVGAVNSSGFATGNFVIGTVARGYLRDPSGTITVFSPPGVSSTIPTGISTNNTIAGYANYNGFIRKPNGSIGIFYVGGAQNSTYPFAISPNAQTIVGSATISGVTHGFVHNVAAPNSTVFDPPGSIETVPWSVNDQGLIAGWYRDTANTEHGFLRTP